MGCSRLRLYGSEKIRELKETQIVGAYEYSHSSNGKNAYKLKGFDSYLHWSIENQWAVSKSTI